MTNVINKEFHLLLVQDPIDHLPRSIDVKDYKVKERRMSKVFIGSIINGK